MAQTSSEPRHKGSNPRIPPQTRAFAQDLYLANIPIPGIAEQTGVPPATIRTWSKRYGWNVERAKVKATVEQLKRGVPVSVSEPRTSAVVAVPAATEASSRARDQLQAELEAQLAALRRSPVLVSQLGTKRGEQGRAAIAKTLAEIASIVHPDWSTTSTGVVIMGELRGSRDAIDVQEVAALPAPAGEPEAEQIPASVDPTST